MSDDAEADEERQRELRNGESEWLTDVGLLLEEIDARNVDAGRVDPWLSMWRQASAKTRSGPMVSLSDSRMLMQAMSNALGEVLQHGESSRTAVLQSQFQQYFPKMLAVYQASGNPHELDDLQSQLQFARYYALFNESTARHLEGLVDELRADMRPLSGVEQRAERALEDVKVIAEAAQKSAEEAAEAADAAKVAAGQSGTNALATEFHKFAESHRVASRNYRFWTIVVLVSAVGIAVLFVLGLDRILLAAIGAPGSVLSTDATPAATAAAESQRWQAVVYRLAILGGLAALSAYLGRQAALHRRHYDWGRAVEAQARSFEAFAKQIVDPDTKKQVQLLFSNRVLGAPPEPTAEKTVARDALQIVADAAIKSRGTA